jgi:hypothetical protein
LKRLAVSIIRKHHPEEVLSGYALVTELNEKLLSFFSTQKFKIDETLIVKMYVDTNEMEFLLRMSHLHEQISSGRIMNAIPTNENPFPARKFYRCFAKVLEVKQNGKVLATEAEAAASDIVAATGEAPAGLQLVDNPPLDGVVATPEIAAATDAAAPEAVAETELKAA